MKGGVIRLHVGQPGRILDHLVVGGIIHGSHDLHLGCPKIQILLGIIRGHIAVTGNFKVARVQLIIEHAGFNCLKGHVDAHFLPHSLQHGGHVTVDAVV